AELLQHARRDAVVPLVVVEAERGIGVDGIEALILQRIGAHLVGEPEAAPFLLEIKNNAAALFVEPLGREAELVTTVAAARSEHVAGKKRRMQPHRDGLGKIRLADDHGDGAAADSIAED